MDERKGVLRVLPCCANWLTGDFGSIDQTSFFLEIWNSSGAQKIRYLLANGRQNEICSPDCPYLNSGKFSEDELCIFPGPESYRKNQEINNVEIRERRVILESFPMALRVIPTLSCNIRCRMCHQDHSTKLNIPAPFMEELRGLLPYIYDYQLHGGEVLISPLFKKWANPQWYDAYPQLRLSLITNGTYIPSESINVLQKIKVNYITISINSATEETYEYITGFDLFEQVKSNVIMLRNISRNHTVRPFDIYISFVIMRCNYQEIPDFVALANELEVPYRLLLITGNNEGESIYSNPQILHDIVHKIDESFSISEESSIHELNMIKTSLLRSIKITGKCI